VEQSSVTNDDFVHLARIALSLKESDIRLFLAKQVRRLRKSDSKMADELESLLKRGGGSDSGNSRVLRDGADIDAKHRRGEASASASGIAGLLKDGGTAKDVSTPLLEGRTKVLIEQVVAEWRQCQRLEDKGLKPTSSMIFEGPPGVGKTLTARWLAAQLSLPLRVLDLAGVMSSYLGGTGSNLRRAIDFARSSPCVLLLDEVDAIAKKRSDEGDVGELKRLVTVMLQELEEWPSGGLLIAATNHQELIDPALWRRFDMIVSFDRPSPRFTERAIERYCGTDLESLREWIPILARVMQGLSFSDVERTVTHLRRLNAVDPDSFADNAADYLFREDGSLPQREKIEIAVSLVSQLGMSQHRASSLTGVSRDTIRKHRAESAAQGG
jgi:SpoVK/Ycf46/Vps4 family AAA+-type ATPase